MKWVDDLKLRASVGQTGNAQIGNSEYLALYGSTNIDLGNGLTSQVYPTQIANNDLGWEKNTQYNVGLDVSLWRHPRIHRRLLLFEDDRHAVRRSVSSVSGLTSSNVNIGSMQNKGIELALTSRRSFGDFSYAFAANWSLNRNKVLSPAMRTPTSSRILLRRRLLPRASASLSAVTTCLCRTASSTTRRSWTPIPISTPRRSATSASSTPTATAFSKRTPTRVIVGNYMPDFYYGFSVNLSYKGFDLAANFQGVYGNEILNLERRYLLNMEASSNMMKESLQRYPYGELNRATRKSSGNNGACTSTFHLEDGSYLRLQNLSLGYTFPTAGPARPASRSCIYVQGTNLFTWTDYTLQPRGQQTLDGRPASGRGLLLLSAVAHVQRRCEL